MVWSFALAGECPCVLSLQFWLINVPGEDSLVVRKPTTIARAPSAHDGVFQSLNYDWCSCFSWEPGNGPWGQGLDTVGWETVLGNELAWRHWIPKNNIPATWSGLPQRPARSLWTQAYHSFRKRIKKHVSLSAWQRPLYHITWRVLLQKQIKAFIVKMNKTTAVWLIFPSINNKNGDICFFKLTFHIQSQLLCLFEEPFTGL